MKAPSPKGSSGAAPKRGVSIRKANSASDGAQMGAVDHSDVMDQLPVGDKAGTRRSLA